MTASAGNSTAGDDVARPQPLTAERIPGRRKTGGRDAAPPPRKTRRMTAGTGTSTAEDDVTRPQLLTAERITVALIPKAGEDLQRLTERTHLSKTDITNRAITLYEFIDAQMRAGRDLLIRDPATGDTQTVVIL
jgi:hypothetical protein